ncbi:uncharacterized protein TM35_000051080 [Trypanosoma theileri]|uniref:Uncharacterized protein n=1 Tax=Trypanosoma theileri TaxID=67003 RepID=A0A1X0P3K4_9TRYP|nr:uncharacterized protein TM35_000051080 [Trypanosoma theileri]ORC91512.1 hypothetical protein TM35_000051080 [Trypanosoma theileri]
MAMDFLIFVGLSCRGWKDIEKCLKPFPCRGGGEPAMEATRGIELAQSGFISLFHSLQNGRNEFLSARFGGRMVMVKKEFLCGSLLCHFGWGCCREGRWKLCYSGSNGISQDSKLYL